MVYFLYALFFISCILLVVSVLLQPGKTDAGALFTSSTSSNAFGPRGTATVLSKVTITAAIVFMVSALLLAMPAITGDISVLSTTSESTTTQPANTDANAANTNVDANAANTNAAVNATNTNVVNANTNAANTNANSSANTNTANANTANANATNANVAKTNANK